MSVTLCTAPSAGLLHIRRLFRWELLLHLAFMTKTGSGLSTSLQYFMSCRSRLPWWYPRCTRARRGEVTLQHNTLRFTSVTHVDVCSPQGMKDTIRVLFANEELVKQYGLPRPPQECSQLMNLTSQAAKEKRRSWLARAAMVSLSNFEAQQYSIRPPYICCTKPASTGQTGPSCMDGQTAVADANLLRSDAGYTKSYGQSGQQGMPSRPT